MPEFKAADRAPTVLPSAPSTGEWYQTVGVLHGARACFPCTFRWSAWPADALPAVGIVRPTVGPIDCARLFGGPCFC